MIQITLSKPLLFSFTECLWFLDRGYDDCLHEVSKKSIRKLIKAENALFLIEITESKDDLVITFLVGKPSEKESAIVLGFVKKWFDLGRDLTPLYQIKEGEKFFNTCLLYTSPSPRDA